MSNKTFYQYVKQKVVKNIVEMLPGILWGSGWIGGTILLMPSDYAPAWLGGYLLASIIVCIIHLDYTNWRIEQ